MSGLSVSGFTELALNCAQGDVAISFHKNKRCPILNK